MAYIIDYDRSFTSYPITLTNLLPDPSFSEGNWAAQTNLGTFQITSEDKLYGDTCLKIKKNSTSEGFFHNLTLIPQVKGHIYYTCIWKKDVSTSTAIQVYWPQAEPSMGVTANQNVTGSWKRHSLRIVRSSWSSGNLDFRIDIEGGNASNVTYLDGAMLIDLTAAFGSGKEPTLEWCNVNIPFFESTIDIIEPNLYIQENSTPKKVSTVYRKINNIWREVGINSLVGITEQEGITYSSSKEDFSLPEEYERINYIQSAGAAYFKTNFYPDDNTRIVIDFENESASSTLAIYGARTSAYSATFAGWSVNSTAFRSDYNTTQSSITMTTSSGRHIMDVSDAISFVDYSAKAYQTSDSGFKCAYPLTIFAVNTAGTIASIFKGKLYSCQIYHNGELVHYFLPVFNRLVNKFGAYDVIEKIYYGSNGTSDFTGS